MCTTKSRNTTNAMAVSSCAPVSWSACSRSKPAARAFPARSLVAPSNHTRLRLSCRRGTVVRLSSSSTLRGSYHCHLSCSQSVWMASSPWPPSVGSLKRNANGWTVHSRSMDGSLKVNGLPVRQKLRSEGVSVVSSRSSRHAAARGLGSVGSMLPEMGAR
jgi:hypothetical protein